MTKEEIFERIVENTKEVLPELEEHDFKMDDSLKALGCNSIDRSEILMMTLEDLDSTLAMLELAKAANIGELAAILNEKA